MTLLDERFPEAVTLLKERFGDAAAVDHVCTKCGHDVADPMWHSEIPDFLGGGLHCFDGSVSLCPECGELAGECASWCSLARASR